MQPPQNDRPAGRSFFFSPLASFASLCAFAFKYPSASYTNLLCPQTVHRNGLNAFRIAQSTHTTSQQPTVQIVKSRCNTLLVPSFWNSRF
jgi:hypothetical protein